jgi:hypothetical protein
MSACASNQGGAGAIRYAKALSIPAAAGVARRREASDARTSSRQSRLPEGAMRIEVKLLVGSDLEEVVGGAASERWLLANLATTALRSSRLRKPSAM